MKILVVTPLQKEMDALLAGCAQLGSRVEEAVVGRLTVARIPDLGLTVARGGVGKAQFAVHTQHLLDAATWDMAICAGVAGGLVDEVAIGDLVVATVVFEHDYNNRMVPTPKPRFESDPAILAALQAVTLDQPGFQIHYGLVASGDEDVIDMNRRDAVRLLSNAIAVAWEGAGGARAAAFSRVPYVEIRGISDNANQTAPSDFATNLARAMHNVALLLTTWLR